MNKLTFEDAVKAIKDASLMPEVTAETENEYGAIRYKVYNTDKNFMLSSCCYLTRESL